MQENLSPKLHKTGEHGLGKHVLAVYSDYSPSNILPFKDLIGNHWKFHYFFLDLNSSSSEISRTLANTFNYYYYAHTLVMDFPAFLYYLMNIERISLGMENLEKIIIYNPLGTPHTLREKVAKAFASKPYVNLVGHKIPLPKELTKQFNLNVDKIDMLHADGVTIISLNDKKIAFKLAAHTKNSKFALCRSYQDSVACFMEEFA